MIVLKTKKEVKNHLSFLQKKSSVSIGFVPTMGALHQGHLSLIRKSLKENTYTIVSIFVNPTQFNKSEDLENYPRTLDTDLDLLKNESSQIIVFIPDAKDLYAQNIISKKYNFEGLDKVMEGAFRPGHFEGVATVLEIFFKTILPTRAYFGEKDYQQLQIIKKLIVLLNLNTEIIGCPIMRLDSGLAMSSRNERLSDTQKTEAALIYKTLQDVKSKIQTKNTETIIEELTQYVSSVFDNHPDFELEYFKIVDSENLQTAQQIKNDCQYRAFIATYIDNVRLIDNVLIQ